MSQPENHTQLLVVMAKIMPIEEILLNLIKGSQILYAGIKDGKINPKMQSMQSERSFHEIMTYAQLFITKMAYEDVDMSKAMQDVEDFRKDFEMRKESEGFRDKGSN